METTHLFIFYQCMTRILYFVAKKVLNVNFLSQYILAKHL